MVIGNVKIREVIHFFSVLRVLDSLTSLSEVNLHVSLKVEEGKLVLLSKTEKLGQLGISQDNTPVRSILKAVSLDVLGDLLAHLSTRHLGTNSLSKEVGKLLANRSSLGKTRRLTGVGVATLLVRKLLCNLHLTRNSLLKGLEITLKSR